MPWFYVDDGFSDSKPVLNMPDRHRLAACGLWVLAGSWSAKEELDGFVPDTKLRQLGARPTVISALTSEGTLSAPLCTKVDGGLQFNSWAKWQKTRAELSEKRRQDAERQKAWRDANPDARNTPKLKGRNAVTSTDDELSQRDTAVTNGVTDNVTNSVTPTRLAQDASRARPRRPDPTRPDPLSGETFGGEVTQASAPTAPTCPRHPEGTERPCAACADARRNYETAEAQRRTQAEQHRRDTLHAEAALKADAIHACTLCDPDGYRPNGTVCDHTDHTHTATRGMAAVRAALKQPTPEPEPQPEPTEEPTHA